MPGRSWHGKVTMSTPDLLQAETLALAMAVHISTDGRMALSGKIKPMTVARSWGLTGRSMRDVLPTLVAAIQFTREQNGLDAYDNKRVLAVLETA